jgi:hypothetical protein
MRTATPVSFLKPQFDNFLYAPIGGEPNEMPLSVLSALARLNLDPWSEAAALSALSREDATLRLAALIARLPGTRWTQKDCRKIAERLSELLPRISKSNTATENAGIAYLGLSLSLPTMKLVFVLVAIAFMIMAANGGLMSSRGNHFDAPPTGTTTPARTSLPGN